ncbi:hypothetical protein [uncultured Sphingomonas sp.]|uniref:hypothetical protein n=1 Tax=uncultured Sphingomonas sp. TaxID=158754 RepID=UPI0035C96EC9
MDRETIEERGSRSATHFIVELPSEGGGRYALCEAILTVDGNDDVGGLPAELVARMFEDDALRAVALPMGQGGGHRRFARGGGWTQSGHNVNININFPPEP